MSLKIGISIRYSSRIFFTLTTKFMQVDGFFIIILIIMRNVPSFLFVRYFEERSLSPQSLTYLGITFLLQ